MTLTSKKIKISLPFEHTKLYTVWHCDSGSKLKRSSSNAPNSQKFAQKERRNVLKGHSIENLLSIEWPSDHHLISANNWPWTSYFNTISCTMYVVVVGVEVWSPLGLKMDGFSINFDSSFCSTPTISQWTISVLKAEWFIIPCFTIHLNLNGMPFEHEQTCSKI